MFSKLSNKTLVVLLLILAVIFYFAVFNDSSDSSYSDKIVDIDTAAVTMIKFTTPGKDSFEVIKEGNTWKLKKGETKSDADINKIKALLIKMSPLKPMRVASTTKSNWDKYGINDKALTIQFYENKKAVATLRLGKVDYQAPETDNQNPYLRGNQGKMIGYATIDGDEAVYVVDGYLKLGYGGDENGFKKKTVIKTNQNNITNINVSSGNAKYELTKKENKWLIDGQPADSATTAKYLIAITHQNGYEFFDNDVIKNTQPAGTITIKTNLGESIKVDAYPVDSVTVALVSSQNEGNVIKDKKQKIFNKLFKPKNEFLK